VTQPTAPPSTGGTHEPNDAPYGDMFFKSYGTNPFIDTEDDAQSTFGLDVDTGSYTLARSYIERGHLPPGEAIRVEEFVNYFDYGDPAPRRGEFTITAEGAPSPFASGPRYQLVRFGIKGREISNAERKPAMLIFVVDVSGSMRRENRLGLVKRSLELLLDQLQPGDQVGLVVYGNRGRVVLEPTSDKYAIGRAIEQLQSGGSTNAEEGLTLAYDLARTYRRRGAINRIILCSDGVANVGHTGPESILRRIQTGVDQGIELTTVGFGMGNYNDVLMEQLANQGDGSYAYIDTLDEARRLFVENLTGTLQTIAADAKIQVEFNPETVSRYRLLGYENRDIADHRFRDDTVDAGEIGAGHEVTALYEIKLHENVGKRDRLATLRLRYRSKATDEVVETAVDMTRRNIAKRWDDASPALRLSSVVAEFAEILKGSYWAREGSIDRLEQRAAGVAADYRGDREVQNLVTLIGQTRRLSPGSVSYGEDE
jgi:Ca-activated chloride channel family protein